MALLPSKHPEVYSEKEMELIRSLDCQEMLPFMLPHPVYRMMVEKVFMDNINDERSDSLRRCIQAWNGLHEEKIFRLTPEWDALIDLTKN